MSTWYLPDHRSIKKHIIIYIFKYENMGGYILITRTYKDLNLFPKVFIGRPVTLMRSQLQFMASDSRLAADRWPGSHRAVLVAFTSNTII